MFGYYDGEETEAADVHHVLHVWMNSEWPGSESDCGSVVDGCHLLYIIFN